MSNLREYFECQLEKQREFNIFRALHKESDEKRLHSRFISFLLSLDVKYLESFLETLGINNFEKNGYQVRPNADDKSEFEDIDILIYNEKQAIIIENKIFAPDQPKQLKKYYETIKTGRNIEIGSKEVVSISYLTLSGRKPTPQSLEGLKMEDIKLVDYTIQIIQWLDKCIAATPKSEVNLLASICQYKQLVKDLASDVYQAQANQEMLSNNIDAALAIKEYLIGDYFKVFKHVQWHTISAFFDKLESELQAKGCVIKQKPDIEYISKVAHSKPGRSIQKLILKFTLEGTKMQICNDKVNGFTLGNLSKQKWGYFSDDIKNIKFCDFSDIGTFKNINRRCRDENIGKMVDQVFEKFNKVNRPFC